MNSTTDTPHTPTPDELADIFRPVPASEHVAVSTPPRDYADRIAARALALFGVEPEQTVTLSGSEYRDNLAAAIREGYNLASGSAA